jgi:hypothetical protein
MAGLAVLASCAVASAQSNDLTFKQTQGDDGLYHIDIGVSYGFPGLPPRTNNSGVGTVRITLPGGDFTLDPAQPVDAGYNCALGGGSVTGSGSVTCSAEGRPQGDGTAFPSSVSVHLVSKSCWNPEDGSAGAADVWAAPADPGTAPDVTLPIQPIGGCQESGQQPLLELKDACKVPNVKGMTLAAATRELVAGSCKRGKVTRAYSPKVKAGRVVKQSARPGKTLKNGAKVNLVISRGKKK